MSDPSFDALFQRLISSEPHPWQSELGGDSVCRDRLIRIPTGFGKTAGVVLSWLHHRVQRQDPSWPRRLVFVLPMRVLVEQTEKAIADWLEAAGASEAVDLHVLMGGVASTPWVAAPERPAILLGTQDMVLSRALNRGFGAARGRWPMELGLLHHDALWVLDEVQLMDVGLTTSVQLAAFRDQDRGRLLRPQHTWWMSATMQPRWLATVDSAPVRARAEAAMVSIPPRKREGGLWEVEKSLELHADAGTPGEVAELAAARHRPGTLTLVVVNRVSRALEAYDALDAHYSEGKGKKRRRRAGTPELRLVHSRFRPAEREQWAKEFLRRDAELPQSGRVVVATQVVEAGVDISARVLVTDLAPWTSMVQRFGRCARYVGEDGRPDLGEVLVAGPPPGDEKKAKPYSLDDLVAASEGLVAIAEDFGDVSPASLERFEAGLKGEPLGQRLYRHDVGRVVRRRDFEQLFDTTPDLSGSDIDVSPYIREGTDTDVSVFWRPLEQTPRTLELEAVGRVDRRELCSVPIGHARTWIGKHKRAYVLDYLDGVWRRTPQYEIYPGARVLVPSSVGGYDPERGFASKSNAHVEPCSSSELELPPLDRTAAVAADDTLSQTRPRRGGGGALWKTIATHGDETEQAAAEISAELELDPRLVRLITLAARWHDVGKAHAAFQDRIGDAARDAAGGVAAKRELAKAPAGAWVPARARRGFRHELASTLGLFELVRRAKPDHAALLGPRLAVLEALGEATEVEPDPAAKDHPLARELAELSAGDLDLVAWLVCTHHGKVRCVWTSTPLDQEEVGESRELPIHGVLEGDPLPTFRLRDDGGEIRWVPELGLSLRMARLGLDGRYGASWAERVDGLRERHGPFVLAFLEAVLRAADWRASGLDTEDTLT